MMSKYLLSIVIATAVNSLGHAAPLVTLEGELSDKLPGWSFKASFPKNGTTYNKFEGYYPDKGGKLLSAKIKLDKQADHAAYYCIRFDAKAPNLAYQGINFYDVKGNLLPDLYDVVYPGKYSYDRVFYAMPEVDSIQVFFQSTNGVQAWNLTIGKTTVEEAAKYCDRVYTELPPLKFTAQPGAMKLLPKTAQAMKDGTPLRVVMLGDSIMQDAFHSQFHALLKREFPKSNFTWIISMRGSTGCWYYCQSKFFKKYVADKKPDLLIIGGISNYKKGYTPTGMEAIELVANKAKRQLGCEVLILTSTLSVDTRTTPVVHDWKYETDWRIRDSFDRDGMQKMAERNYLPLWDMATPAYTWLYKSGLPLGFYSRDKVHSGEKGKQVIGRILFKYFKSN